MESWRRTRDYFCDLEITAAHAHFLVERDGFEPEISVAVLPRTQSEKSVQLPAVNAARLPMDGTVEASSRGVDELPAEPNAQAVCALRVNRWANETRIGAKGTPWLVTRRTAGVDKSHFDFCRRIVLCSSSRPGLTRRITETARPCGQP